MSKHAKEWTAAQLNKAIAANKPRPYNLNDPAELRRLYFEAWGYLKTCHHKHGTDWEGRQFCMDALGILAKGEEDADEIDTATEVYR